MGTGKPVDSLTTGFCVSQVLHRTCRNGPTCPFDHDFNVVKTANPSSLSSAPTLPPPPNIGQHLANSTSISTNSLKQHLQQQLYDIEKQEQNDINERAQQQTDISAAAAHAPSAFSASHGIHNNISNNISTFSLPSIAEYLPRPPTDIKSIYDTGFQQVGSLAVVLPDVDPSDLALYEHSDDVGMTTMLHYLFLLFLLFAAAVSSIFSATCSLSPIAAAISSISSATLSFLSSPILAVVLLPLTLPLTLAGMILPPSYRCVRSLVSTLSCSRRSLARQESCSVANHKHVPRTLPVLEDSGATGVMSGDMNQSIGPKRPCRIPVQVANNEFSYSDHTAKISLDGQLVDCLFINGFHQTLVSKGILVNMGKLPTTNAQGRTDYVDSTTGQVFLSFQLQPDNLFHLVENTQPKLPSSSSSTAQAFNSSSPSSPI